LWAAMYSSMELIRSGTELKLPRRSALSVSSRNQRSRLSHDDEVGVKCKVEPRVEGQPRTHVGVFVGGVVVQDQVHLQRLGDLAVEPAQEHQELFVAVARQALADHDSGQHVERSEQCRCACSRGSWCRHDPSSSAATAGSGPGPGPGSSCATRRRITGWRWKDSIAGLSQQAGEAEGSLSRETPGRVGAALTTTGRVGTARRSGPA